MKSDITSIVQCISCACFSFKRVKPEEARDGLGHCQHRATFIRHNAMTYRECESFEAEAAETVNARKYWLAKKTNG